MSTYRTKSGATLTDDEIERLGEAAERGEYPGTPGEFIVSQAGLDSQTRILSPLLSKCHAHIETHWTVGLRRRAKLAVSSCEKHSKEH